MKHADKKYIDRQLARLTTDLPEEKQIEPTRWASTSYQMDL